MGAFIQRCTVFSMFRVHKRNIFMPSWENLRYNLYIDLKKKKQNLSNPLFPKKLLPGANSDGKYLKTTNTYFDFYISLFPLVSSQQKVHIQNRSQEVLTGLLQTFSERNGWETFSASSEWDSCWFGLYNLDISHQTTQ